MIKILKSCTYTSIPRHRDLEINKMYYEKLMFKIKEKAIL